MNMFHERVVIVTGGASGIGKAIVEHFVRAGARCVVADIDDEAGRQMTEALGEAVWFERTDVTREDEVEGLIHTTLDRYGRLDCLVNNAGILEVARPIDRVPLRDFDRLMNVHVRGVFLGMRFAMPVMRAQRSGAIVNIASVAGLRGKGGPHVYGAAKAAVIQMTRSVALEAGAYNVRVNCVCPGLTATPIFGRAMGFQSETAKSKVEALKPVFAKAQVLQRPCLPEDVARAVLWLAAEDAGFITGHALVVDGGMTCGNPAHDAAQHKEILRALLSRPEG